MNKTVKTNNSYTSANSVPTKIFCDDELILSIKKHFIKPIHLQMNPTNRCPGKCSFCSCKHRDRNLELQIKTMCEITKQFGELGTKAITITGGGDPLAHPHIVEYINFCKDNGMKIGLVTEGIFIEKLATLKDKLEWVRISLSDECEIPDNIDKELNGSIDWSLSYVLTQKPNIARLMKAIDFANHHRMTHIRVVTDILSTAYIDIKTIENMITMAGMDTSLVIWQNRQTFERGHKRCLLSLLKPNVTPDGNIVPCCGIQYASNPPMLDWPRKFHMHGTIKEIWSKQMFYDGSDCERCYYCDHNNMLNSIWDSDTTKHKEFI